MAGGEVARDEFEALKIRVTVMENAVNQLTQEVAALREEMNERFDQLDQRVGNIEGAFAKLKASIDVQHAALMSAILALKPGR